MYMILTLIAMIAVGMLIISWAISAQRRLVVLEESIHSAMSQIGVQVSSRFDALNALVELTKDYAEQESRTLIELIRLRRSVITAKSIPDDVVRQEKITADALRRITMIVKINPELQEDLYFTKTMNAVETYESMIRTSCFIYNDSVFKLNREIRMFPVSMIANILGIRQKQYVEV